MASLQLLIDLHKDAIRQGPGGDEQTRMAITLSGLQKSENLRIADIGCGAGAPTLVLARELEASITAIDLFPEFLAKLDIAAQQSQLSDRIKTASHAMESLPFAEQELDAIWSEGAIYNMGFEEGIKNWRRFLKPGGILAVSEISWLTEKRPEELTAHWKREYPQIDTAPAKMAILQAQGFTPLGYFILPEHCWLENYYHPLQQRFPTFLDQQEHSREAQAIVKSEEAEIALFERYKDYFNYGYYIVRKEAE